MKKVIFICLLSLTTCLSRPDETQVPSAQTVPTKPAVNETLNITTGTTNNTTTLIPTTANNTQNASQTVTPDSNAKPNVPPAPKDITKPDPNAHPTEAANNIVVTDKPIPASKEPTKPSENESAKTPAVDNKNNTEATPTVQTTLKPETKPTPEPTLKPVPHVEPKPDPSKANENVVPVQAKGFDGASFIGGIILTLGLLAIGFMGFKYYKNQTERNYHTL